MVTKKKGSRENTWNMSYRVYDENGISHRKFKDFHGTKAQAVEKEKELVEYYKSKVVRVTDLTLTFGEFLDHYLQNDVHVPYNGLESSTKVGYNAHIRRIQKYPISNKVISKLEPLDFKMFINALAKDKYSVTTIRHTVTQIGRALKYGIDMDLFEKNPLETRSGKIKAPKKKRGDEVEYVEINPDMIKKLLFLCRGKEEEPVIQTFLYTGLRLSELKGLRWSDVLFNRPNPKTGERTTEVRVRQSIKEVYGKDLPDSTRESHQQPSELKSSAGYRTISVSDDYTNLMKEYKAKKKKEAKFKWSEKALVFGKDNGEPYGSTYLRDVVTKYRYDLENDDLGPQYLRHCFATIMITAGENPSNVMRMLGHSNIEVTMKIYNNVFPPVSTASASRIDGWINSEIYALPSTIGENFGENEKQERLS